MSLPSELDFELDREASPARMNRAMEYLFLLAKSGVALQPQFQTAIDELTAVGLTRLNEVLTPIFIEAEQIATDLAATKTEWLTGDPLADLLDGLEASATAAIGAVAPQLAAQNVAVAAQIAASVAAVTALQATYDGIVARTPPAVSVAGKILVATNTTGASAWSTAPLDELRARHAIITGGI